MNAKVERFITAIRPPTPAISDNPITWYRPDYFTKYHERMVKLSDGELTLEAARYTHSIRTNILLGGLNIAAIAASAVVLGHFHQPVVEWVGFNGVALTFNITRGIAREYEKRALQIEKQRRRDRSYR